MESVGEQLVKERERRGLSIEEVAAATKIQPKFIRALEENRFEVCPGGVFVKGFLKAYASYLKLDAEELIELYKKQYNQPTQQKPLAKEGRAGSLLEVEALPPGQKKRSRRPLRVFILLLLLLSIWRGGLYVYGRWQGLQRPPESRKQEGSGKVTPQMPPRGQGGPSSSRGGATTSGSLPEGATPERSAELPLPEEQKTPDTETLVLAITALENTWMRVEIDGKERRELFLKAGQSRDWQANEGFSLTVGNVKGVRVRFNGKAVSLPPGQDNVLRDFRMDRGLLR